MWVDVGRLWEGGGYCKEGRGKKGRGLWEARAWVVIMGICKEDELCDEGCCGEGVRGVVGKVGLRERGGLWDEGRLWGSREVVRSGRKT